VSDSLLGKDSFNSQCLSVTSLVLCATDLVNAVKQNVSIDLW